jgi:hypothetical protein
MPGHPQSRPASITERTSSPFRLNLEQQRKRAKELLAALRSGDATALKRYQAHHPQSKAAHSGAFAPRLADAQLVIARELGLPSWPKLKAHIEAMEQGWQSIHREPAPDRDMATLHIRCGHDIGPSLKAAGFAGDFLSYADPLCHGPLSKGDNWLKLRADFLAQAYGSHTGRSREHILDELMAAEAALQSAAARYERVVLWFEHDSYDQLILARCLAAFAQATPAHLELVSAAHFLGAARFIGLGQLPPEALRLLWRERARVSVAQLREGAKVWEMLRADDPRPLSGYAAGAAELPLLAAAIRRHCQDFPWTTDGLGLTQRLILQLVGEQPQTIGAAFNALQTQREPLPFMTDLMMLRGVQHMQAAKPSVLESSWADEDRHWGRQWLAITPMGRSVLTGETDFLSLHPPVRWLGGVRIAADAPCWRWDEGLGTLMKR